MPLAIGAASRLLVAWKPLLPGVPLSIGDASRSLVVWTLLTAGVHLAIGALGCNSWAVIRKKWRPWLQQLGGKMRPWLQQLGALANHSG